MATFLDIGLLEHFLPVFSFLLILVVCYAILKKTELLGSNNGLMWVASFSVAFLALFSGSSIELIALLTPWFVVMFIFLFLLFMILIFGGVDEKKVLGEVGGPTVLLVISILMLIIGISNVFGDVFSPYGEEGEQDIPSETMETIFHPRILGAIFILLVAAFTVNFIPRIDKVAK